MQHPASHQPPPVPNSAERLERALLALLREGSPLARGERAAVVFDAGSEAWTMRLDGPRVTLALERARSAAATLFADAGTLAAIVEGTDSGVDAFLDGRLTMRGNIALALRLQGLTVAPRPARVPRARSVPALGIDTFYLEAGAGPPVVLLHGLGATNASMLPTLADLSHDHRVIAPDLPGFGASGKPVRAYHPAFYAAWLREFLNAAGVDHATLVGNSMGGRIAIELALAHPERVQRLVLFAPSMAFRRLRAFAPVVRLVAAELAALPLVVPRAAVDRVLRSMFARPERLAQPWYDAAVDEFLRVFSTTRGRIAFFSAARQIYLEEPHGPNGFWERLPGLVPPSLFLWGDRDVLVPAGFARHAEAAVPHARSVILEDCGHVPQFEHPALTHRLVREFLASTPPLPAA